MSVCARVCVWGGTNTNELTKTTATHAQSTLPMVTSEALPGIVKQDERMRRCVKSKALMRIAKASMRTRYIGKQTRIEPRTSRTLMDKCVGRSFLFGFCFGFLMGSCQDQF